jgi:hypothetical protein
MKKTANNSKSARRGFGAHCMSRRPGQPRNNTTMYFDTNERIKRYAATPGRHEVLAKPTKQEEMQERLAAKATAAR